MAERQKFCILTSQRSGSTWLKSLLDSHPRIRCLGELFLYRPWPEWPDARLLPFYEFRRHTPGRRPAVTARYLAALSDYPGDHRAIGFKLMYNQLVAFPEILYTLLRQRFRLIHLVRLNPLDVVISRQRMRQTGLHHSTTATAPQAIHVDVSRLHGQLLGQQAMVGTVRAFLKAFPLAHREITYEGLRADQDACLSATAQFVGLGSNAVSYQSELRRISAGSYRKRIANYEEVSAKLGGTRFARLLTEE
ncbi:MAG: sulfotransferase [Gammaproteobacteria bacterium]